MEVTFPTAVAFDGADSAMTKAQALKVLEEAAELVEAVKDCEDLPDCPDPESPRLLAIWRARSRTRALDEAMDVHQALANLLAGEFSDEQVAAAYGRCVARNRERGRL